MFYLKKLVLLVAMLITKITILHDLTIELFTCITAVVDMQYTCGTFTCDIKTI